MTESRLAARLAGLSLFCGTSAFAGLAYAGVAADKAVVGGAFIGVCCLAAASVGGVVGRSVWPRAARA